eukprot:280128_1
MNQEEVAATETTKLNQSAPTYAQLGGQHQSLDMNAGNEEYITFDFMVSLSSSLLTTNNNLQLAIKQSVDCELNQIKNLSINEIDNGNKKECRVRGKVYTDDWELTMLQKKFQKIISDRVLSGNLQSICELDDRPTIRRFYCKTSKQLTEQNENKNNANALAQAHKTPSFRTAKDDSIKTTNPTINIPKTKAKAKVNESISINDQYENNNDNSESSNASKPLKNKKEANNIAKRDKEDSNCECFCVIL